MKKHIITAVYIGTIIGFLSGIIEALILILKGSNLVTRHHLFMIMVYYFLVWVFVSIILGFIAFLITKLKKRPLHQEKLTPFYISAISFFSIFLIVGVYLNKSFKARLFTLSSLLVNIPFVLIVLLLSFLIYKFSNYIATSNLWSKLSKKTAPKKIKLTAIFSIIFIVFLISFYPSRAKKYEDFISSERQPLNIVLILIDALRADHLSCYGYPRVTSPNIDSIASEGVIFTNAFSNSCWTKPATATIFSSIYLSSHNVYKLSSGLSDKMIILPEVLKKKGFSTAIISSNFFVAPSYGFDQGVDFFYAIQPSVIQHLSLGIIMNDLSKKIGIINPIYLLIHMEYFLLKGTLSYPSANRLNKVLFDWIDSVNGKSFFAYLHYNDVHDPYFPPAPYDEMFLTSLQSEIHSSLKPSLKNTQPALAISRMPDSFSLDEKQNYLISQYDGGIRYTDSCIGELIDELRKRKILDQTLIIITSDHGEEFFEHGGWGHSKIKLYDTNIHIPLIMRYPKKIPPGTVITELVQQVDLMPTILDMSETDLNAYKQMQGYSLKQLINQGDERFNSRFVISESYRNRKENFIRAIRNHKNKLILSDIRGKVELSLFDLVLDPEEKVNIADRERKKKDYLLQQLIKFINNLPQYSYAEQLTIDDETKERLKALGYIK